VNSYSFRETEPQRGWFGFIEFDNGTIPTLPGVYRADDG
jgi:hypothetical protein